MGYDYKSQDLDKHKVLPSCLDLARSCSHIGHNGDVLIILETSEFPHLQKDEDMKTMFPSLMETAPVSKHNAN